MTRYKPVGWRGESYRHYLAAKGIPTKRYFVRNELKGNRGNPILHSLWAQGYSSQEIESLFGIQAPRRKKKQALFDVPDRDVVIGERAPAFTESLSQPPSPVPAANTIGEPAMKEQSPAVGAPEPAFLETAEVPEMKISTPGVPPQPEEFDVSQPNVRGQDL